MISGPGAIPAKLAKMRKDARVRAEERIVYVDTEMEIPAGLLGTIVEVDLFGARPLVLWDGLERPLPTSFNAIEVL